MLTINHFNQPSDPNGQMWETFSKKNKGSEIILIDIG